MKRRELHDLWLAIAIALLLLLYVAGINYGEPIKAFLESYAQVPFAGVLVHSLAIWLFGLMWIAYRRWRDVTVREERLAEIFFSINPVILMVANARGCIVACNPAVGAVLGYTPGELVGSSVKKLIPQWHTEQSASGTAPDDLPPEGYAIVELSARRKDGQEMPVEIVTCELQGERGTVSLVKDITERVRAEQALLAAKEDAERAHLAKSRLLEELQDNYDRLKDLEELRDSLVHMIVHDMKSPLQIIMSSLELMNHPEMGIEKIKYEELMTNARTYSERLLDMMNSLLDISRMEAGRLQLKKESCDVKTVIGKAVDSIAPVIKRQTVRTELPKHSITLKCDPAIVHRILINLLSNACKYTHRGDVITVEMAQHPDKVEIAVQDTGPGIASEYHDLIFEKFGQVKSAKAQHKWISTGLGLTFCKLAVEAHGGQIGIQSTLGEGSRFFFTLPLE
jgi:PAS domain S-box-containing protein